MFPSIRRFGQSVPFSPYQIPRSLLCAWWCADDHGGPNMTDDGAGLISAFQDRINGINLTAAGSARPTWAANSFLGTKAGLTGDGTAVAMASTSFAALPQGTDPGCAFIVATAATGNGATLFGYGGTTSGAQIRLARNTAPFFFASNVSDSSVAPSDWPTNGAVIGMAEFSSTLLTGWANGIPDATPAATSNTIGSTRLRAFAINATTASAWFAGTIRHILVTRPLTTALRQKVEGWLAWDSGVVSLLSADHPWKGVRP